MNKKSVRLTEQDLQKIIKESVRRVLAESVTMYGRTMLTYDDIPYIMNGKIPYDDGKYGRKWYVLQLPNGKYTRYNATDEEREKKIERIIDYCNHDKDYGESKSKIESFIRFKLQSKDEAEEWLMGQEICSLLDDRGYETEMWGQLGRIGGISATKNRKTIRVVHAYPQKKELMQIIGKIKNNDI